MSQQLDIFAIPIYAKPKDMIMIPTNPASDTQASSAAKPQEKSKTLSTKAPTRAPNKAPKKWLFVTNHQNLPMYLAMNAITSPEYLGKRYYADSLSLQSGYMPIFASKPPQQMLEMNTAERADLIAVIIEIDLSQYQGKIWARFANPETFDNNVINPPTQSNFENSPSLLPDPTDNHQAFTAISATSTTSATNEWRVISLNELYANDSNAPDNIDLSMLLLAAPVATSLITAIKLPDKDSIKKIKDKALDTNNVDLSPYKFTTAASMFKPSARAIKVDTDIAHDPNLVPANPINYPFANAMTAVYSSLHILANVNEQALYTLLTLVQQPLAGIELAPLDDILAEFCHWVLNPNQAVQHKAGRLFIDMVQHIIEANNLSQAKRDIIDLLQSQIDTANAATESQRFIDDLSSMLGLADKSFDDLIATYTKSFHRMLLTFFHIDDIERFLAFDKKALSETQTTLALILIAANTGWLKLPKVLKSYAAMNHNLSGLLTSLCHAHLPINNLTVNKDNNSDYHPDSYTRDLADEHSSSIEFTLPNSYSLAKVTVPLPISFYLKKSWTKKTQEAAKILIKQYDWACITYEVSLPNGHYDLKATGKYAKFTSKVPITVTEIVDQSELLTLMRHLNHIDTQVEQKIRKVLGV